MAFPALKPRRAALRAVSASATEREVQRQRTLSTRICDLDLSPDGVLLECIDELKHELKSRGISFVPEFYLGDDDFWTADKGISVNVPWYLANATLWRMVNDHLFVYSRREVLMYLRHETGHALNYAFELWRRKDWGNTFGDFHRPYRDVYNPNPWSRDYVRYLHRAGMYHYAQKHPDEDWAETFGVWLDPTSRWRYRYRDWQVALAKLEYVDRVIEVEGACSSRPSNQRIGLRIPYTEIRETVAESFRINDAVDPDLAEYRRDLMEIFPRGRARSPALGSNQQSAARFIQQHQTLLTERLAGWIGNADRRVISKFLRQLEAICTQERLVIPESRRHEKLVDLTIVATWHVVDGIHRLSG